MKYEILRLAAVVIRGQSRECRLLVRECDLAIEFLATIRFSCPSLGGLSFIAEDDIEFVLVSWTLTPRFRTLLARWLGLIALLERH